MSMSTGIDRVWRDRFAAHLRIGGWSGAQIGDAVAVVEEHCAESGEPAQEAFGAPEAYAASLSQARPSLRAPRLRARDVVGIVGGLVGLLLATPVVEAATDGTQVAFTVGQIAAFALALVLAGGLLARPDAVLRRLVRSAPWQGALAGLVPLAAMVGLMVALPQVVGRLDWVWPAVVAVVGLVVSVVSMWPDRAGDPIRDPLRDPGAASGAQDTATSWVTVFLFPLLSLLVVAMTLLLAALD